MYKYLFLVCLLMCAVTIIVDAQGLRALMGQNAPSSGGPTILGSKPSGSPPTSQPSGSDMAMSIPPRPVQQQQPVMFNPFYFYRYPVVPRPFYGLDINDLLWMHYFDFGLY